MDTILELKKQIEQVILLLEQRLMDDPDRPILKTLYDRYVRAEEILTNNDDIKKIIKDFYILEHIFCKRNIFRPKPPS